MAEEPLRLRPVLPPSELAHRPFLVAALLLATLLGFLLAVHVPVGRLLDAGRPERTADLIHGHGQAQLLGFAGLFVMGMSLRLLPRFTGTRLAFQGLAPVAMWSMTGALVLRAGVLPWLAGDAHAALLVAATFGVLLAAACFLFIVAATLAYGVRRADPSGFAFLLGAGGLFAVGLMGVLAALDAAADGRRAVPYLSNAAIVQVELTGFLLVFAAGVGLRALPVMAGRERPLRAARLVPPALTASTAVIAAAFLYLEYASYSRAVVLAADGALILLGLSLLAFVWHTGVLRPAANRLRPASQPHLWLIRGAVLWTAAAGAIAIIAGAESFAGGSLPSQFELDALRHSLGVGVVTGLILGMALMILPEFAVERQQPNQQRALAFRLAVLVNAAALLRVAPALAGTAWSADARDLAMAVAGSLAEVALLLFAFRFLRLVWRTRGGNYIAA